MDEATALLVDGLMSIEEEVGASINWNGKDYPCAGGAEFGGRHLAQGGYRVTAQVTIAVRLALFDDARPQEKQKLTYTSAPDADPRPLRIDSITPFRGAFLVMECNDPNQGG